MTDIPHRPPGTPSHHDVLVLNRREYDDADDPYWRLTVYQPVHGGWRFANIGGATVLETLGREAALGYGCDVLEMCSGSGDTCRYLAQRFGCRVTGVELNEHQFGHAVANRAALDPELAARLRYVCGDLLTWTPDRAYDASYAVDGLALVEDRRGALRKAHQALRPGGLLLLAEVIAGPCMTPEVGDFIWREDGIVNLPQAAEQIASLEAAGFGEVRLDDWTPLAETCFAAMDAASCEHRETLVRVKGEARFESWLHNTRAYRSSFGARALLYALVTAVKR